MATNTIWTYQLNGATREFSIKFDYLSRKFIQVTLIGSSGKKLLRFLTDYRFLNAGTIITNEAWGPSRGYDLIEIKRVTSATDLIVDFTDGSILRANDLTESNLQAMHIAEEARDIAGDGIGVDDSGDLDARNRRIINLASPVNRRDAVTKAYVDDAENSVIDSKNKALQYRNESRQFRNEAEIFKNASISYSKSASGYKDQASQSAERSADILEAVTSEAAIVNGYALATIEHSKASAANAKAALVSATAADSSRIECAGSEAATAAYAQGAKNVEANVIAAKDTAESKAKEANVSASKANTFKEQAEQAKAQAKEAASNSSLYKDSAAQSAEAAARDAMSADKSASNAITQAGIALQQATLATTKAEEAKGYADSINPSLLVSKTSNGFVKLQSTTSAGDILKLESLNDQNQIVSYTKELRFYKDGVGSVIIPNNKTGTLALTSEVITKDSEGVANITTSNRNNVAIRLVNSGSRTVVGALMWSDDGIFKVYREGGSGTYTITFPVKTGTVALREETIKKDSNGVGVIASTRSDGTVLNLSSTQGGGSLIQYDKDLRFWTSTIGSIRLPKKSGTLALEGSYLSDSHYKRTRTSIAKSKLSERSMRKEIEDLKTQLNELKEMLLDVTSRF